MEDKKFIYDIAYRDEDGLDFNGLPWLQGCEESLDMAKSFAEELICKGCCDITIFKNYGDIEEVTWDYVNEHKIGLEFKVLECIQWKGDNLKDVIEFTGKHPKFDEWFPTFEEYEKKVKDDGDIFKLFIDESSHFLVPRSAWLVKCPDGNIVPSKGKQNYYIGL